MELDLLPPWLAHLASPTVSAAAAPITFPATPLKVKVEVALGADLTADPSTWGWADATALTYTRDAISITRGRPDESATVDSCQLNLTGDNRGGHWSTRNPNSPWFGLVRKGSPIRVSAEGYRRFSGFLSELPPRWDVSGNDRYAPVAARGVLYRLAQGASPERSAMRRTILGDGPIAYWPMEDEDGATRIASGLSDGPPIPLTSATDADRVGITGLAPGGDACVDMGLPGSSETVALSLPAATTWSISFAARLYIPSSATSATLFRTHSTLVDVRVYVIGQRVAATISGTADTRIVYTDVVAADPTGDADPHHYVLTLTQSGADIAAQLSWDGNVATGGFPGTATLVGCTNGTPETARLGDGTSEALTAGSSLLLNHLAVFSGAYTTNLNASPGALNGYDGEQAHLRFLRLCDEEGIACSTGVTTSQQMGPQPFGALVELLRQCEATDSAYLYEGTNFDLVFQGHAERENMAVLLALDYATSGHVAPPLDPTDDDQRAVNDVEAKRDGGSSFRITETSTTVELSIPNIGRRDESVTLSQYDDSQPQHAAGWRLHQGLWSGYRFPVVTLNLAAAPSLIPAVCTAGLAFRSTISHPPTDIGPDAPDLIFEGYTEKLGLYDWDLSANCSPFGPWRVMTLANDGTDPSPTIGRDDWDSCVVVADSGATMTVAVSPLITTDAAEFPLSIRINGELITVTACAGASSPQTLTVTRSVNGIVKTHAAGALVELVDALVLTL